MPELFDIKVARKELFGPRFPLSAILSPVLK